MKIQFRPLFILTFLVINSSILLAQNSEKTVIIISTGSGVNQDEAKQAALKSAIEQAFGAFVSSKTEILNDQVVSDQITSVSSGNIQSYEIVNESKLAENSWVSTVKAVVSIDKLISFVQSKGVTVEINGGLFMLNIKQQALNESGEINTIYEMAGRLHEMFQNSFDFTINSKGFIALDANNKEFKIPLAVSVVTNNNIDVCNNYILKILKSISLSTVEKENYESLKKNVYRIEVEYQGQAYYYYLRKELSLKILSSILKNWNFYINNFKAFRDDYELVEVEKVSLARNPLERNRMLQASLKSEDLYNKDLRFKLYQSKKNIGTIEWDDFQNFKELENLKAYVVKPNGTVSQYKEGGYLIYESNDGHGLIASLVILGKENYPSAETYCNELTLAGFTNFRLPTIKELEIINSKLIRNSILNSLQAPEGLQYDYAGKSGRDYLPYAFWSSTRAGLNSKKAILFYKYGIKTEKSSTLFKIGDALLEGTLSEGLKNNQKKYNYRYTETKDYNSSSDGYGEKLNFIMVREF